jgi:hypothetical protein
VSAAELEICARATGTSASRVTAGITAAASAEIGSASASGVTAAAKVRA